MKEEELDQLMHDSFSQEDRELVRKFSGDPSVFEMIGDSYRGRNRWLSVYATMLILVSLGGAIWCGIRFAGAEAGDVKELVGWAIGMVICVVLIGMLKLWFWLEMQRNAITREIKRLEITISHLVEK